MSSLESNGNINSHHIESKFDISCFSFRNETGIKSCPKVSLSLLSVVNSSASGCLTCLSCMSNSNLPEVFPNDARSPSVPAHSCQMLAQCWINVNVRSKLDVAALPADLMLSKSMKFFSYELATLGEHLGGHETKTKTIIRTVYNIRQLNQ